MAAGLCTDAVERQLYETSIEVITFEPHFVESADDNGAIFPDHVFQFKM